MDAALRDKLRVFSTGGPEGIAVEKGADPQTQMREAAFEEGYRAGRQAAEEEAQARASAAEGAMVEMAEQLSALVEKIEESHARAAGRLLQGVLPALAHSKALEQAASLIASLSANAGAGKIVIRTSTAFAKELTPVVLKLGGPAKFAVEADGEIDGYRVDLAWEGGGGEIDIDETVRQCQALLDPDDSSKDESDET